MKNTLARNGGRDRRRGAMSEAQAYIGRRLNGRKTWIVFYGPDGDEFLRIDLEHTFAGEIRNTMEILAAEKQVDAESISFELEDE